MEWKRILGIGLVILGVAVIGVGLIAQVCSFAPQYSGPWTSSEAVCFRQEPWIQVGLWLAGACLLLSGILLIRHVTAS